MFSPRNLIIAGVVLIAIALGSSGHGLWWLVGFLWFFLHGARNAQFGCQARGRSPRRHRGDDALNQADEPVAQPDPTADRHEAFPAR